MLMEFKSKTPMRESGTVRAWGTLCPPRSFLRPAEYQTQQGRRKGPSRLGVSSVVSRGIPSGPYSEPRAKADDRKRATTRADVHRKALGACSGVSPT